MYAVSMKDNISNNINIDKEKIKALALENNVKFVVLFGSFASDKEKKESDIDVALYLNGNQLVFKNFPAYSQILSGLIKIFSASDKKIVDIVDLKTANILLRYEITSKGKLLYGDEIDYEDYKSFAFRDYIDARRLFEVEDSLIKKRQKLIADILK